MKPKILPSDKCGKKGIKIPTRQTKGTVPILVPLSQVSCTALLDLKKKKSKSGTEMMTPPIPSSDVTTGTKQDTECPICNLQVTPGKPCERCGGEEPDDPCPVCGAHLFGGICGWCLYGRNKGATE